MINEQIFNHISNLIPNEPEKAYDILAKQNQNSANTQRLSAICLMKLDKHEMAIPILLKLIRKEEKKEDYIALSAAYSKTSNPDDAINVLRKLLKSKPHEISIALHLADKMWVLERYQDALELLKDYSKKYVSHEIWNKLGDFSIKILDLETAEIALAKSLNIKENSQAHLSLADLYNLRGQWKEALAEQEWRMENYLEYKTYFDKYPKEKMWDGKASLKDKTVMVYGECGFGDIIQYYRFIKDIPDAKIIFNCPEPLLPILNNYETFSCNVSYEQPKIYYNYHILSCSLPYLLDVPNISGKPYLKSVKNNIQIQSDKLKVGIVWAGNKLYRADKQRSIPVEFFNLKIPNTKLFSLQLPSVDNDFYTNLAPLIKDFSDTADILSKLDLLLCCDTGSTHLAGAMGIKTYMCSAFCPDSRWGLTENNIWYDYVEVIRQKSIGDWMSVFEKVKLKINASINLNIT